MADIAKAIRQGASAFLKREAKVAWLITFGIAIVFGILFHPYAGLATFIGMTMSTLAGLVRNESSGHLQ